MRARCVRSHLLLLAACAACAPAGARDDSQAPWSTWSAGRFIGDSLPGAPGTIGSASESVITRNGHVVVLDGSEGRLLAFDTAGTLLARSGGRGDGPGEFRMPVGIALIAADSVIVADLSHRRLSVFTPVAAGLRFTRAVTLEFAPGDLCALGPDVYVLGMKEQQYLHRLPNASSGVRSLSPVAREVVAEESDPARSARRFELGGGDLLCDDEAGLVVHVPELHGVAYGIKPSGELMWMTPIDSFVPPVRTPRPGGIRYDLDPVRAIANRVATATLLGDGTLQVIVQTSYPRESGRERTTEAVVMRVRDGMNVHRANSPPVFGVGNDALVPELVELPQPGIRIWRRSRP